MLSMDFFDAAATIHRLKTVLLLLSMLPGVISDKCKRCGISQSFKFTLEQ